MAIIRANKNKGYTVMSNYHLRDINLSLKAKGLLSVIFSLPENWKYSTDGLVSICKESETAVRTALNELKKERYLIIRKIPPTKESGGKYEYIYDIYEEPQAEKGETSKTNNAENQKCGFQDIENQGIENQDIENHPLYKNTNISNTDLLNTNNNYNIAKEKKQKRKNKINFIPPTYEEVEAYAKQRGREDLVKKFYDWYTIGEWKDRDGEQVISWKQKFLTWEYRNEKPKQPQERVYVRGEDSL